MVEIDQVAFDYQVIQTEDQNNSENGPKDSYYIYGGFMEGAKWDNVNKVLGEC